MTGAVFIGVGEFGLTPSMPLERKHLGFLTRSGSIAEPFTRMVIRFTDSTYEEIKGQAEIKPGPVSPEAQEAWDDHRRFLRKNKSHRYNLDARILVDLTWPGQGGLFQAFFKGNNSGDLLYGIDPLGAPSVTPEEVVLIGLSEGNAGIWVASHLAEHYRAGATSNEDHRLIDHLHCGIEATVKSKTIDARVQARFKALVDGARVLPFDLYPTLRMKRVSDDQGQDLKFIQEKEDEDADFYVMLPQGLEKGQEYALTFEYAGDEAVTDSGGGNFTLTAGARTNWYPNSSFLDRATYEMAFRTPKDYVMVATGQPIDEAPEGDLVVTRWKSDVPLAVAGFNYGKFKKTSVVDEKLPYTIESYANKEIPDVLKSIQQQAAALEAEGYRTETTLGALNTVGMMDKARAEAQVAVGLFSDLFGPLPYGRIAMTQQPYLGFGQAWPMLIYMPIVAYLDNNYKHQLGIDVTDTIFKVLAPHEVAHQWWGHIIGWKSYRDQWIGEGFAVFSAAMFAQAIYKSDLFIQFWKEQRQALLEKNERGKRPVDIGSVTMGYRLNTAKTGSVAQSMIYSKGGFILHMLRMLMWDPKTGDQRFLGMMKNMVKTHYNQNVSTQDFWALVERHMTPEMDLDGNGRMAWFFNEWVFGDLVPEYKLEHRLEPGPGGKMDLVGRITQSRVDENFKMRVPIYLEIDGRMIRLGTIPVTGNSTTEEFRVTLPKKPKRVLLCYYEDVLCTTGNR
ncbi:MAG: M1 family metallopeptidase [Candidatus Aminicenantes bacterium]|nr:M1 family metallopeptidase [Candidatus Aminicenantes bacterium]NTV79851.1 M1 family metallopeptidase [Candidatus Aminicenantes bacterium]